MTGESAEDAETHADDSLEAQDSDVRPEVEGVFFIKRCRVAPRLRRTPIATRVICVTFLRHLRTDLSRTWNQTCTFYEP